MRPMVIEQRLVQREVFRIPGGQNAVRFSRRLSQSPAPRVGGLTREAARQAFRELHLQRMIRGIARISMQPHLAELGVQRKERLGQPPIADEAATLTCDVRAAVEEIR